MCHEPATGEMRSEAIARSYRANPAEPPSIPSINAVLAELQAAREAACPCNSPEWQARRALKIQAVLQAKARALRARGEYARPRPPRREPPHDPVLAGPDRPNPLPGGAYCRS
jgi:hypothetical protein